MVPALKITISSAELATRRREAAIEQTRGVLTHLSGGGRSLVSELIAERRTQARAETRQEATEAARRRRASRL